MRARLLARLAVLVGAVVVLAKLLRPTKRSAAPESPPQAQAPPDAAPLVREPATSPAPEAEQPTPACRHAPESVSVRAILLLSLGLVVSMAVMFVALRGLQAISTPHDGAPRLPRWSEPGPAPELGSGRDAPWRHWVDPWQDAELVLDRQRQRLDSYGWIDSSVRIVHVPIDRALEAIAGGQDAQTLMQSAGAAR